MKYFLISILVVLASCSATTGKVDYMSESAFVPYTGAGAKEIKMVYRGLSEIEAEVFYKSFVSQRNNYEDLWNEIVESGHVVSVFKSCNECFFIAQIETHFCSYATYIEFQKENEERFIYKNMERHSFDC